MSEFVLGCVRHWGFHLKEKGLSKRSFTWKNTEPVWLYVKRRRKKTNYIQNIIQEEIFRLLTEIVSATHWNYPNY